MLTRTRTVALASLVLAASGCSAFADDEGTASDGGGVQVAAAFYPLEYVAERVAGPLADVAALTTPGKEPHDLELTVRETAEIAGADLVVYQAEFQAAVDAALEQNGTGASLDAAEVVDLQPFAEEHAHDEEDHEGEEHSEEEHSDEEHAHDEEGHSDEDGHSDEEHSDDDHEGHDHDGLDPHFWLDPLRMADLGDAVAESLGEIDPDNAAEYDTNAAGLREDLEALDGRFTEGLASCERSTIVVSHDAFGYLTRYGLEMAPVAGLSPDAEPTPADLAELQEVIADEGVTTVFAERLVSPRLVDSLADDMGVDTDVLDPIEGLSDETADEDYLSLMDENLAALERANACT